jgi:poly-gamma-glutamate capsule biosynthesis protein CapA/YwtB (metallophosphatase superfamily)
MLFTALWASLALAGAPEDSLKAGIAAQRADDAPGAIRHYTSCLEQDADHVACHWEIGWSYWTTSDWERVVEHWERVKALDATHAQVDRWLPVAQSNLEGRQRMRDAKAAAPAVARPPLPEGKTVRLRLVGDIMIGTTSPHPTDHLPPEDGRTYFDAVTDLLSDADITFGNLEGPLCDTTDVADKCQGDAPCYAFRQPTRYADLLRGAGFDLMSIANNHMMDFGEVCRAQTREALDRVGIAWSGPPGTVATVTVDGIRVGMIAFHTAKHSNYVNDHETAKQLVEFARRDHDLVIVSFHGGAEGSKATRVPDRMEMFYGEQRGHLRQFAREVIAAGAHLVVGHGPHVLRAMEVVDGHLVAYSLGNFATYARFNLSGAMGVTTILEVELDHRGKFIRGKAIPIRQLASGIPTPDPEGLAIGQLRDLSELDFPKTKPTIAQDGTFAP